MILLCLASNSYKLRYLSCIKSQENYCYRYKCTYRLISGADSEKNWKRAKIEEIEYLLENTEEDICLIDADCYIKDTCPPMNFTHTEKSIYYVNGKSGRLNSGFLYFKNNDQTKKFIKDLKEKLKKNIPRGKGYFVTAEGENGHIIWLQDEYKQNGIDIFHALPVLWNCTSPKLENEAYVLHFTNDLKKRFNYYNNVSNN